MCTIHSSMYCTCVLSLGTYHTTLQKYCKFIWYKHIYLLYNSFNAYIRVMRRYCYYYYRQMFIFFFCFIFSLYVSFQHSFILIYCLALTTLPQKSYICKAIAVFFIHAYIIAIFTDVQVPAHNLFCALHSVNTHTCTLRAIDFESLYPFM